MEVKTAQQLELERWVVEGSQLPCVRQRAQQVGVSWRLAVRRQMRPRASCHAYAAWNRPSCAATQTCGTSACCVCAHRSVTIRLVLLCIAAACLTVSVS